MAPGDRLTGSRQLAEMLHAYGVTHQFFVPTMMLPLLAEADRLGIRAVSAHGEKAAAYMADGYARVSGRPGICLAQTVGAANLASGLKDAQMACSPVIAITGGPFEETRFRHVYQEIADYGCFAPLVKWQASVEHSSRLPELARQAFRVATSGSPGPVHLEVRGHSGQIVEEESAAGRAYEPRFGRIPAFRPEAQADLITAAARMLEAAERPVIIAGGGVISSGAEAEVVALAEKISAPVATSMSGKAAIAEYHPLAVGVTGFYSRRAANQVVAAADLIFYVGSRTGSMVTTNWKLPRPGTAIIHLDINPEELGRHLETAVGLQGDAKASLLRLIQQVQPREHRAWVGEAQAYLRSWREEVAPALKSDSVPIRPERICAEIEKALPADGAVVVDTLQAAIWGATMIGIKSSAQRYARCAGSLGWALPATIGAKCALGERAVIGFMGDGGAYYHLAELETAARNGINAVFVVNNNSAYAGEQHFWPEAYGPERADHAIHNWTFDNIDFARCATDMGCLGIRVERPADIAPALQRALTSGRPTLIDVASDPAAFHPKGWLPEGD
ncbi:MAG TPA: thiamine pyrophosphate-binding protein [Candidatus Acidoferrales bacterium]|nr:thiamine pyrophosphate-binding protein [Candidatus Acidoferrales bacterium]